MVESSHNLLNAEFITEQLRELGDPEIAAHSQRFFKTSPGEYGEGDRFLGIRVPLLRRCVGNYKQLPLATTLDLLQSPFHEARLLALLILVAQYTAARDPAARTAIYRAYLEHTAFINNWDLVDSSAPQIVGAQLYAAARTPLDRLVASESLWERRIAIMATFTFIRQGEFVPTLSLAERLLNDREALIHKAVGWMLREVGNRDRDQEQSFLDRHYRIMPRTMLRYAIEKFPEKLRQAYLRGER